MQTLDALKPEFFGWAIINGALIAVATQLAWAQAGLKWYKSVVIVALLVALLAAGWSSWLNPRGTAFSVGLFVCALAILWPLYRRFSTRW
ncbi:hypothetical protein [Gloeobacter violaceus]|uniref:hypothetical protein n=1 Tax=Gloeobacter violaceus TaxID=33072 RepID=UPI0013E8C423|nr:hypothetical protein [Gloeobacter violaceus]